MENNPYIYDLSQKLEYSKNGNLLETYSLEFKGPNLSVFKISSKLSQLVMRALIDAQDLMKDFQNTESKKSNEDSKMDSNVIKMVLYSSKNVSFYDIAQVCNELFTHVGTYDGSTKIKEAVLMRLDIEDYTNVVCGYIANFIFPSLFKAEGGMNPNGSTL